MKVVHLTKERTKKFCKKILSLEKFIENIGSPDWTEENLMLDLPKKWELSFMFLDNKENINGYVIASERNNCYHVHRPFLHPKYRGKLTHFLVKTFLKRAKEAGFKQSSWKSGTRIIGFGASRRFADREEYIGKWDNSDFYYFYKDIN